MKGQIMNQNNIYVIKYNTSNNELNYSILLVHPDNLPINNSMLNKEVEFEIVKEYDSNMYSIPATYAKLIKLDTIDNTWNQIFKDIESMDVYLPIRIKNLLKNTYHNPIKK